MKQATPGGGANGHRASPDRLQIAAQHEPVPLCDLTDCLLHAYDSVARRAYERYVERGAIPGQELEDWLTAERELLPNLRADFEESDGFIHGLASVPGFKSSEIAVGVEPNWVVILAQRGLRREAQNPATVAAIEDGEGNHSLERDAVCAGGGQDPEVVLDRRPQQMFCVRELPAKVDPARVVAVLSNGLLGIRMAKAIAGQDRRVAEK